MNQAYAITPNTKPRMTRADKWKQRPCVMQYRAYKDALRALSIELPESGYHLIFVLPMPKSWSKKKRAEMRGQPHKATPDKDNLEKGLLDALFVDDAHIWDGRVSKYWGDEGQIIVKRIPTYNTLDEALNSTIH
ncbi:RusA family crossover junction endodeoxyribonuclease [Zooshikella marina]|uniref:RusA family crossover junction endodeoxyribonuclease n=1 Tax=Zooshikella ganghwensis TaxID=202772 RepID=UPI001BB089DA|nr:RusA family crossover junction endodeoxyribonuclease [Zooshikella ganghwensis]MBU2709176.1 RusA family crossover junction endodeoxyribonuclease [Zooshikella ganghwensis]